MSTASREFYSSALMLMILNILSKKSELMISSESTMLSLVFY